MKNKKIAAVLMSLALAVTLFAGCSSAPAADNYLGRSKNAGAQVSSHNAAFGDSAADVASEAAEEMNQDAPGERSGSSNQQNQDINPEKGRLLIRTVTMSTETTEFDKIRADVESKVKAAGGYIENSGVHGTGKKGKLRNANYTIRIPAESLDSLIASIGEACTVTQTNESTQDVTLSYVDTKARVESLRIEQKQLTEMLSKATELQTIITLQERLTQVRYEIESAESTLRVLENQVTYATLNLNISEVLEEKEQEEAHIETYGEKVVKTFKNSLKNCGEFFKGLFLVLVAVSPVIVPIGIIVFVIILLAKRAGKKRREKRALAMQNNPAMTAGKAPAAPSAPAPVPAQAPAAPAQKAPEAKTAEAPKAPAQTEPAKKEDSKSSEDKK